MFGGDSERVVVEGVEETRYKESHGCVSGTIPSAIYTLHPCNLLLIVMTPSSIHCFNQLITTV